MPGLAYFVAMALTGTFRPGWLQHAKIPALLALGFALFLQVEGLTVLRGFCPACLTTFVATLLLAWSLWRSESKVVLRGGGALRFALVVACLSALATAIHFARPKQFTLDQSQRTLLKRFALEPLAKQGPYFVVFSDLGCPSCYAAKPRLLGMRRSGRLIYAPVAKHPGEGYVLGEYIFMECLRRGEGWLFLEKAPDPDGIDGFCHLALDDLKVKPKDLGQYRAPLRSADYLFDVIGTGQTPSVFRMDGDRLVRTSFAEMLKWRRP